MEGPIISLPGEGDEEQYVSDLGEQVYTPRADGLTVSVTSFSEIQKVGGVSLAKTEAKNEKIANSIDNSKVEATSRGNVNNISSVTTSSRHAQLQKTDMSLAEKATGPRTKSSPKMQLDSTAEDNVDGRNEFNTSSSMEKQNDHPDSLVVVSSLGNQSPKRAPKSADDDKNKDKTNDLNSTDTCLEDKMDDVIDELDYKLKYQLHVAVGKFDVERVKNLLEVGHTVNYQDKDGKTPLHELVSNYVHMDLVGRLEFKNTFVDILTHLQQHNLKGGEVDKNGCTAMHLAAQRPDNEFIIRPLVLAGVPVNVRNVQKKSALHYACHTGNYENVKALLEASANPNLCEQGGQTPVHYASKLKNSEILELLLKCGGDPNYSDKYKQTPLHLAVKTKRINCVQVLMEAGAKPDRLDIHGLTPLHMAAKHDMTGKIMNLLVDGSMDVNRPDDINGETALHKVVYYNMVECFKVLIRKIGKSPNPNVQDNRGDTPLHKAAAKTDLLFWVGLMKLGADARIHNHMRETPESKAAQFKNHTALSIIRQYQAMAEVANSSTEGLKRSSLEYH